MPITPHAIRPPALPVFFESGCSLRPKSSIFSWITKPRPTMFLGPPNEISRSWNLNRATPDSSACTLPRSPTCLTASVGAPWSCYRLNLTTKSVRKFCTGYDLNYSVCCGLTRSGLKWPPVLPHPPVMSPFSCTWKPCGPGGRPTTAISINTGSPHLFCVNVTLPWMFMPVTRAMARSGLSFNKKSIFFLDLIIRAPCRG